MKLVFLTSNINKLKEVQELIGLNFTIENINVNLDEIQSDSAISVIKHKLEQAKNENIKELFFIEDTSLYLGKENAIGPLIKFFPNDRIVKAYNNEDALAVCTIGLSDGGIFTGSVKGKIVQPKGVNGFGWDTIFKPNASSITFAEMTTEEKNSYSMRKIAIESLKKYLNEKYIKK